MNIITVIPLVRTKGTKTLTYFTASEVPRGAVVSVPLRAKTVHAIVTDSKPAEDLKSEIRRASYEIRKLGRIKAGAFFSSAFMDACATLADYYATTVGAVVSALVPEVILDNAHRISPPLPIQPSMLHGAPAPDETYAVQGDAPDRLSSWRSLIRQDFVRKKSLAIYCPTIEDARQTFVALEKGIEGYIFLLHGSLAKKKIVDTWTKIAETSHPVVIIATASFSILPRGDIESIVIERENSRGWISMKAPYLDARHALETIGRRERRNVYLSDALLRIETLDRVAKHEIIGGTPFKWRSVSTAKEQLVDMRHAPRSKKSESSADSDKPEFRVISVELEKLIRKNHEENTHLFMLTSRRGTSPITICDDCDTIVICRQCSAPVVLYTSKETGKNFFMCHACGERRSAQDICATCGGHRLTPLGIGIDRVVEEVKVKFPGIDVLKIDADTTKTEAQIAEVLERFRDKPGSVLVGTETALNHLSGLVEHTAVVSLDSLFALPDFRMQERLMYTLIRLRAAATRSFLVQTRRAEEKVFEYGLKGNLSDFYHSVLAERRKFDYPPYSLLLKITLEGKKDLIARQMGELQALLIPHEIDVFPAFTSTVRGSHIIHGLVKIPPKNWPEPELMRKLRSLPPNVYIKINPESLL
ncbi:MAG: hypothetical protein WCV82_01365 [Candidatus Paceibacterota bacterium]